MHVHVISNFSRFSQSIAAAPHVCISERGPIFPGFFQPSQGCPFFFFDPFNWTDPLRT